MKLNRQRHRHLTEIGAESSHSKTIPLAEVIETIQLKFSHYFIESINLQKHKCRQVIYVAKINSITATLGLG